MITAPHPALHYFPPYLSTVQVLVHCLKNVPKTTPINTRDQTSDVCSSLIVQRKWNTAERNLQPGDVVIIADKNTLRGEYRLGQVKEVYPSADGQVRQVTVRYTSYKVEEKVQH